MNLFLKYTRRALAVIVGSLALLFFLDILNLLPTQLHGLMHIQIVPAIMAGSIGILVAITLLTLLLGRVYCSVLCPLGILQDVILRVRKWHNKLILKKRALRFKYTKPYNIVRYSLLVVAFTPLVIGITYPLALLDPYSIFGRIAVSLFRPVVVWGNNLIAGILNNAGNFAMYAVPQTGFSWVVLGLSVIVFLALIIMVWNRGRLWCNTICPVGTLLGLVSRCSLFRVTLDENKCNKCGLCGSACKAECIDSSAKTVDTSRCVGCFDCLTACKHSSIGFKPNGWNKVLKYKAKNDRAQPYSDKNEVVNISGGVSRREFLKGSLVALAAIPASTAIGQAVAGEKKKTKIYPLPPGAVSMERFRSKCTGCQLCVSKCPTHVLQPAFMEHGVLSMMQPYMKFDTERFCNYECKVCTEVCPNGAILPLTIEEKKVRRVGMALFKKEDCRVFISEVDCGACAEHCPSQAVHMVPYLDGLTIPRVTGKLCIGCGGCESICPVEPKAIQVVGIPKQNIAMTPVADKKADETVSDFGF